MSHCRTAFHIYVSFIRTIGICCSETDSTLLNILLLTSHGFVDESWMGTPTDLAGVDERAPISKILPHDVYRDANSMILPSNIFPFVIFLHSLGFLTWASR